MKFAYVAAALFGLAYGNSAVWTAPEEDSLAVHEARKVEDVALLDERDDDVAALDELNDLFTMFEEREAEFGIEDDFEAEETELEARSAASILGSLKRVGSAIRGVQAALNKFGNKQKPTQRQALAVQAAGGRLSQAVSGATGAARKSGKLNAAASKKVFKYVNGALKPATLRSLQSFIAHKPGFQKGGYTGLVKKKLSQLKGQTGGLGSALLSKASGPAKKKGGAVLRQIQSKFTQAINAY